MPAVDPLEVFGLSVAPPCGNGTLPGDHDPGAWTTCDVVTSA
jgi:hypothetical protein